MSERPASSRIGRHVLSMALMPAIAIAVILGTYAVASRIDDLRTAELETAEHLSSQLVPAARFSISMGEFTLLQQQVEAAASSEAVRSIRITDGRGTTLVYAGDGMVNPRADSEAPQVQEVGQDPSSGFAATIGRSLGGGRTHTARRAVPALVGSELGTTALASIEVTTGGQASAAREGRIILLGFATMVLTMALAALIALRVASRFARPLASVSTVVSELAAGTLGSRVAEVSSGHLGDLERGVNQMAVRITDTKARLEEQVQKATMELRETLAAAELQNIELEAARARAEAASDARAAFLANMSHEIRTPLNAVMGFAGLLDKTQLTPIQRSHLQTIQRSTDTLIRVIDDILNWSQLEAGKLAVVSHPFRLKASVEDAVSMLQPGADAKGLSLSADLADDLPTAVTGDAGRIRQILVNLINNSIKFTDEGEVHVSVFSGGPADGETMAVVFEVSDTGRGIDEGDQARLFEPFEQADLGPSRSHGGTGLGLAICLKLAEAMGGSITLDSAPGQGSTFRLKVPLGVTEEAAALQAGTTGSPLTDATMGELLRVDLPRSRQVLQAHWEDQNRQGLLDEIHSLHGTAALCHLREVQHLAARCERVLRDGGELQRVPIAALVSALNDAADQLEQRLDPELEMGSPTRKLAGLNLLIADDNELNRRLLRGMLEQHGATVHECESGREVLDQSRLESWDALLIDVHMPGLSGCETVRRLRRRERGQRGIPVIAVSADGLESAQLEARDAGVDEYLVKPYSEGQLLRVLDELIKT
jgi:two-component system sensor histidine kinase BarA